MPAPAWFTARSRGVFAVALYGVLAASGAPSPAEVLIDTAPEGYVLSPERQGITGPLTPRKLSQLAGAAATAELDESTKGYIRFWSDRRGGAIVAVALRSREGDAGAAILRGALEQVSEGTSTPFAVPEVEGAHGFTSQADQAGQAEGPVVVHSVLFRRGPLVFLLSVSGPPPGPPVELVRELARAQDGRAPAGPSGTEDGLEGWATPLATVALGAALAALFVAGLAMLVGTRRSVRHPAPDEPSVRPPSRTL